MTIEQLFHFTEVYRQRSITQAAANLYVSRQALSLSVKKLEEEFGAALFTRLANGVEPTKAGQEFYRSAQAVLSELSALRQNMRQYSAEKPAKNVCRIGVVDSVMSAYGDRLFTTLSTVFPHTYFDFSTIVIKDMPQFYTAFDFSIAALSDITLRSYTPLVSDRYVMKHIAAYPLYIWVSASSPWNEYTMLTFDMLHDTPFCSLKNKQSGISFMSYLESYGAINKQLEHHPDMALEKNFIDYIENFGYYTIDLPLYNGKLLHEDLFRQRNVALKPTPQSFSLEVIYDQVMCQDFYPVIADILAEE